MGLIATLTDLSIILLVFGSISFMLAVLLKRNDLADVVWGIGFIVVCIYAWNTFTSTPTALAVYGMTILWGLRLSIHIGIRNSKKEEDFRYKNWRNAWGRSFYLRSYLQVFLLQMIILLVVAAPIYSVGMVSNPNPLSVYQWMILPLWLLGFGWQAIADYQLSVFKKRKEAKVMSSGLWKFSRHPNYFGEIVMWWSLFLFIQQGSAFSIYAIISPLMITYLLTRVSGVPMLEEKYKNNIAYQEYIANTPAVFPSLK